MTGTAVRIPTFRAHAESIVVETEKPIKVREALEASSSTSLCAKDEIHVAETSCCDTSSL